MANKINKALNDSLNYWVFESIDIK
jgi:hypothetical protein